MSRNLILRFAVAIIAIPAIIWIAYQGGAWLAGLVLFLATGAALEFLLNEGFRPTGGLFWLGTLAVVLMVLQVTPFALSSLTIFLPVSSLTILVALFMISGMILAIGKQPPEELFRRHSRLVWGVAYIGLLYPIVFRVGEGMHGISGGDWLLLLFCLLWSADTSAYAVGKAIGKRRLAPAVSPNKTVEGFVGGIAGSLVIALAMYFWRLSEIPLGHILAMAVGCSVFGQLGDLVESMWKRSLGIKDSSQVIPGHGGILDRFDSLLFGAPFMFGYLYFVL